MAFISNFCFLCSVRLGSIITGLVTLIQACLLLAFVIYLNDYESKVTDTLHNWIDVLHLESHFLKQVANHPHLLLTLLIIFFSFLIISCFLLLYGCFQIKVVFLYPFVFFYLFYIFFIFGIILGMIFYIKIEGNGLGVLIVYSNLGGFVLLCYLYTWSCILSLIQIIHQLQERLKHKLQVVEKMKFANQVNGTNQKWALF